MVETRLDAVRVDRATLLQLAATLYGKPGAETIPKAFELAAQFALVHFVEAPGMAIRLDGDVFTIPKP